MAPISTEALTGRWQRTTDEACADAYPEELEFTARGVYTGSSPQRLPLWDAGGYEVLDGGKVRIATANDAEIVYDFVLAADSLTFTDATGCRFTYRRKE